MNLNNNIIIIDGTSFIFRAYHAMPELTAPDGHPTGATRGTINMLKLLQKKYPDAQHICVFDTPSKNFRHELYPEYKSTRKETPNNLILQLDDIYNIIRALGIPLIMQTGIEADDIIATLAMCAKAINKKSIIVTGDKDFAQLVDEDISLMNTMTNELLDTTGVVNKFGVKPTQIVDYLCLIGDTVDNIPGVPGCGPKTAAKWLLKYESLENIIQHAHELTGVVGENFRQSIPWFNQARLLVTLNHSYPLQEIAHATHINNIINSEVQTELLHGYYTKLGFKTWLEQLTPNTPRTPITSTTPTTPQPTDTSLNTNTNNATISPKQLIQIHTLIDLTQVIDQVLQHNTTVACMIIVDNYTQPLQILSFTISTNQYVYVIHLNNNVPDDLLSDITLAKNYLNVLKTFTTSMLPKVLLNAKETLSILHKFDLPMNNVVGDITLAHYIINSKLKHNMANIYQENLNLSVCDLPVINIKHHKDSPWLNIDPNRMALQCDALMQQSIELEQILCQRMNEAESIIYHDMELPLIPLLLSMEQAGITLNLQQFNLLNLHITEKINILTDIIYQLAKCVFNINSPQQLQNILFNQLKLPTIGIKKTINGLSTDEDSLIKLNEQNIPIANYLLEYRTLSKLLNTYISKLPNLVDAQHKVHTTFEQALVTSGRLSSRDPNLQNIPIKSELGKQIRQCFIASPQCQLICADYSQIELRILAHISADENLLNAFQQHQDIHAITASEIFHKPLTSISKDERRYAKTINFSLLYGKTIFGLAQELKIDHSTAKEYINQYFAKYPKIKLTLDGIKDFAHEHGYVETVFGRRIYLSNINSSNRVLRDAEERLAQNAPMQGTAADIIKKAMLNIDQWLQENKLKTKIILQVHDELIFEVPLNEIDIVKQNLSRLMNDKLSLKVPMTVEIIVASSWGGINS